MGRTPGAPTQRLRDVPPPPDDSVPSYHMFFVLLSDNDRRNDVLESMGKMGVRATFHYLPLHTSDAGRTFAARTTQCPVSEDVSGLVPKWNGAGSPSGRGGSARECLSRLR